MRKKEINLDTRFRRNPDLVYSEIDNEVVILSIANGEYYNLNSVGSDIWHLLDNESSFKNLLSQLMQTYQVSEEACLSDTMAFLQNSLNNNIIEIINERAD